MLAINKIYDIHKFKFSFGMASHELYEASGCSEDWFVDFFLFTFDSHFFKK